MKKKIREKILAEMAGLSFQQKKAIETKLYQNLLHSELWKSSGTIGITMSMEREWSTLPIIEKAWEAGKEVSIPAIDPNMKTMQFHHIQSSQDIVQSHYGISEPRQPECPRTDKESLDLVIVPGVAFNENGYRIGYGGGYYDRFLADYRGTTISLCSEIQLSHELPVEVHDIPVHYIMTEKRLIRIM